MRRLAPWLCAGLALFAAGTIAEHAWRGVRPQIPEIGRKELEPTLGPVSYTHLTLPTKP
jgi:hypothetical protein